MGTVMSRSYLSRLRLLALSLALPAFVGFPAYAEDVEIYVGGSGASTGVNPNILFVLDSSGSMGSSVFTQEPWDPNFTYSGSCVSTRYYWSSSGNAPSCGTDNYVEATAFHCDAAVQAFAVAGKYTDRFGQWRNASGTSNDRWRDMNDDYHTRLVDCKADDGNHGEYGNNPNGRRYANYYGSGPWDTTDANNFNWNWRDSATFFTGNYLNWYHSSTTYLGTRLEVMQDVTNSMLGSVTDVNIGLMRFDRGSDGGMVIFALSDIDAGSNRADAQAVVSDIQAGGGTPLSETYWEAYRYFSGNGVDYGQYSDGNNYDDHPSVAESRVGGSSSNNTYNSPIDFQCQRNFIVYLTDGEPTNDGGRNSSILGLSGMSALHTSCGSNCMDELASYMNLRDMSSEFNGTQTVQTYTIGFTLDLQLLEDTADNGGGQYYIADDTAGLIDALTAIITEILAVNTTFTAPAVSVNAFNRTVHLNQLFFTLFKPSQTPHWDGNVKRFDLAIPTGSTQVQITDANGQVAVNPVTGFFDDGATSFWTDPSEAPDGGLTEIGGAAGELTNSRNVFTYMGASTLLTNSTNLLHESNVLITGAHLGDPAMTAGDLTANLRWARGVDADDDDDDGSSTDARRVMGDPLHSKPVVVTFGGTIANPDITIFLTTNDGYLHAIDGNTGLETFSFMPPEFLSDIPMLRENFPNAGNKHYALDGSITPWVIDHDGDGVVESVDGDRVYIYFGQRRGGSAYYALDVTDRNNPRYMWRIDNGTTGFGELGQSWSQPTLAQINDGTADRTVLVIGAGYDEGQDSSSQYQADGQGRGVFMIDALTGSRVWWSGPSSSGADLELADHQNSIPSTPRVIDMEGDGYHDRMYVGDTGGRLFRFDINNGSSGSSFVAGGMIADLGAANIAGNPVVDSRRFYETPDVALIVDEEAGVNFLNVAIGSGYRAHPLDQTVRDSFFAVRDYYIFDVPSSYAYGITKGSLYDATDNLIGEGSNREAELVLLGSSDGWYIDLETSTGAMEGEKVMAPAQTLQSRIMFTTFTPVASASANACAPSQGTARTYIVAAATAEPVLDLNEDGNPDLDRDDRTWDLVRGGIPPEVTVLFPEVSPDQPIGLVGPEQVPIDIDNEPVLTYWFQSDLVDDDP